MSSSSKSRQIAVWSLLLSLVIAVGVHAYLTLHFYDLEMGNATGQSMCNINETFNCDAVSASDYSSIMGVPLALFGAVTNGILLCLLLFSFLGFSEDRERVLRYGFWIAFFIAGMSVIMGGVSAFLLTTLCLFCIITYGLSLVSLAALWVLQERSPFGLISEDLGRLLTTHRAVVVSVALIPALSFLFHFSYVENSDGLNIDRYIDGIVVDWKSSDKIDFNQPASLHSAATGSRAVMSIVEFADFRCGHCKKAVQGLHAFMANHKDDVEMKFYSFPLDGECNEVIGRKGDGITCRLSKAVYCAGQKDPVSAGWRMHDVIFENQQEINSMGAVSAVDTKLKEISASFYPDFSELEQCMTSNSTHEAILAQAKLGEKAGVEGTPAIFINGRKIQLGDRIKVLKRIYKELSD